MDKQENKKIIKVAEEAVRIYFKENCSAKDAIEKAKKTYEGER